MWHNKKGQEEIVGFVLIVIIISVVLVVLLGIMLRTESKGVVRESIEVHHFLESSSEFTTNCSLSGADRYEPLRRVIDACATGKYCQNGLDSCRVLNETYSALIDRAFPVGDGWPTEGYSFAISRNLSGEILLEQQKGVCSRFVGDSVIFPPYEVTLTVC